MTLCHSDRCWAALNIITVGKKKKEREAAFEREGRINPYLDATKPKIIFLLRGRLSDQLLQDQFD